MLAKINDFSATLQFALHMTNFQFKSIKNFKLIELFEKTQNRRNFEKHDFIDGGKNFDF